VPRKPRKTDHQSPLAVFIEGIIEDHRYSAKQIASELGVSPSVVSAWRQGTYPASEQLPKLRTFSNRFGKTLAQVLTGELDAGGLGVSTSSIQNTQFDREHILDALCEIKIVRLLPKG
jgi:transcriptional regulator with XRE-family HTH domain